MELLHDHITGFTFQKESNTPYSASWYPWSVYEQAHIHISAKSLWYFFLFLIIKNLTHIPSSCSIHITKNTYVCIAWPHTNSFINSLRARDCQNRTQLILCSIKTIQITVFKNGEWALSCWYRGDHGCPYLYKLWCCNIKCNIQIEH